MEAIEQISKNKRKRKYFQNKHTVNTIENKINNWADLRKNWMVLEFDDLKSWSVKSIAAKNETNIKCTTRFLPGKLLMFANLSLKSFICSLVELLYFPEENPTVASIYEKYDIEKIHCYHIHTHTNNTAIQFIVSNVDSTFLEFYLKSFQQQI